MCKHFISQFKVVQVHPIFLNPTSESKPHLMEFKHVKKPYCVQINFYLFILHMQVITMKMFHIMHTQHNITTIHGFLRGSN